MRNGIIKGMDLWANRVLGSTESLMLHWEVWSQGSKSEGGRKGDWKQTRQCHSFMKRQEGLFYQVTVSFMLSWNTLPRTDHCPEGQRRHFSAIATEQSVPPELTPPNVCNVAWPTQCVKPDLSNLWHGVLCKWTWGSSGRCQNLGTGLKQKQRTE